MPDPANDECPYPGLRAYFTRERDWYFGREEHVDAMLSRLEESRFLAVVGSSGSGKSSLVFAGLIPALIEGQLAGSRRDANDRPAPWSIVCFNPGNDPLAELAAAIVKAAPKKDDSHLAGYVRAALESGGGLVEALKVADLISPERETLVYADQFEELFRFGEKASRAAQENALRFARLFVDAAEQTEVRLHMLLSMRSEFIGQCEAFPGLPEIVSRSQFLAPRLSRKQLERSLSCPAVAVGWKVAPDALTAVLNDCGNSPDQLPLAQHILRRMWKRAALAQRRELTLDDYQTEGGVLKSIAEHGKDILNELPQPAGTEVTRILFMALCEQREDGPLVRRLSTRAEIEAIAGVNSALVPKVIAVFAGDDPGFIQEDDGWLDVRHEAVLRQWPLISEWRTLEGESETWLHELSQAARDYEKDKMELWRGNDLREAEIWFAREKPSDAWAIRHSVKNWAACVRFLEISRQTATELEEEKKREAIKLREAKERRQNLWLMGTGAIAIALFIIGLVMTNLWKNAASSRRQAEAAAINIGEASKDIVASGKAALSDAEQRAAKLVAAIRQAGEGPAPSQEATDGLLNARTASESAAKAIEKLATACEKAAAGSGEVGQLNELVTTLNDQAKEVRQRLDALKKSPDAWDAVKDSIGLRLTHAEEVLGELRGETAPEAAIVTAKEKEISLAGTDLKVIDGIQKAAFAFGFDGYDYKLFADRIAQIETTLNVLRKIQVSTTNPSLNELKPEQAVALKHAGKVNCVHFSPVPDKIALIAAACEDRNIWIWRADGKLQGKIPALSAVNDIAFSPGGDAIASAGDGKTVRVFRGLGLLNLKEGMQPSSVIFDLHKDSITDVEFSHGGERIASASADHTVRVFDSRSMAQLYGSQPLPGIVTAVQFHRGDNLVVSGCDDGGVRLHTIDHPEVKILGMMGAPALRPEFSYDGKFVIAAGGDKSVDVFSVADAIEVTHVRHPADLTQATFRPVIDAKGYTFISCDVKGNVYFVRVADVTTAAGEHHTVLDLHHPGPVLSATWSADGRLLATAGGGEVIIWEMSTDIPSPRARLINLGETSHAEFSPDSKSLVTYGGSDTAYVWDLSKISPSSAY
jgi:WD40 repeat protein/energy-coupling factor transporter ATP-binding protein EcfA2